MNYEIKDQSATDNISDDMDELALRCEYQLEFERGGYPPSFDIWRIERQMKKAADSYITAAEFEDFKKNILGTLLDLTGDITRIDNRLITIRADIHNIKTKEDVA